MPRTTTNLAQCTAAGLGMATMMRKETLISDTTPLLWISNMISSILHHETLNWFTYLQHYKLKQSCSKFKTIKYVSVATLQRSDGATII